MKKIIIFILFLTSSLFAQITTTADFTNNQYDSTYWGYNRWICSVPDSNNKIQVIDDRIKVENSYYSACPNWYDGKFSSYESSTTSNIDFSGRLWTSDIYGACGFRLIPSNNNNLYVGLEASNNLIYAHIYNSSASVDSVINLGVSNTDTNRVYRIIYQRSNDQVKFYYKENTEATIWTQLGTNRYLDLDTSHIEATVFAATTMYANYFYIDDLSLTYTPYGAPIPDTLVFHQPGEYSPHFAGDTVNTTWYSTKDSVRLFILGDTINVYNDTSYSFVLPDTSNFVFQINGEVINPTTYNELIWGTTYKDSIRDIYCYYFPSDTVEIDTVYKVGDSISIITFSKGVDSLNYYVSTDSSYWVKVGETFIDNSGAIDTISFTYSVVDFPQLWGELYFKVEEKRDITPILPVNHSSPVIGGVPDTRICYYDIEIGLPKTCWERDLSCQWNASWGRDFGYTIYSNTSYSLLGVPTPNFVQYYDHCFTLPCYAELLCASNNGGEFIIDGENYYTGNCPLLYNNPVFRNYRYMYDTYYRIVYVVDLVQGDTTAYCDLSDLYRSDPWRPAEFGGVSSIFYDVLPSNFLEFATTASSPAVWDWDDIDSLKLVDSLYWGGSTFGNYLGNKWQATMLIQSHGSFPMGETVAIPMIMKYRDRSPLVSDIYSSDVPIVASITRNYFRGIHPKIWKYGNINGVKP